jgi:RNA polymerase sigma-70 factor, ECF subfamily
MQSAQAKRDDVSHHNDEDLVALAREGKGSAFRAIMQRYNRRLYRVARGIVRDGGEAEDILQEAYVRAFAALGTFRGDSSLSTWLTRIVVNEALGRLRRQHPTEDISMLDKAAHQGDPHVICSLGSAQGPIRKPQPPGRRCDGCLNTPSPNCPTPSGSSS